MRKRILAVDYGERRIGLALSDPSGILATPLCTLDTLETPDTPAAIAAVAAENGVELVLVGYPLHLDGRLSEKAQAVDRFIAELEKQLPGLPVERTDERYSSVEASTILKARRRSKRTDKKAVDRVAAAVILQEYLNEHSGA